MGRAAISINVLAKQVNFTDTLFGKLDNFGDHVIKWAANFFTTRVRYDTEGTVLAAAFHDRYKGFGTFNFWCW